VGKVLRHRLVEEEPAQEEEDDLSTSDGPEHSITDA
jgi:hypothetical protein